MKEKTRGQRWADLKDGLGYKSFRNGDFDIARRVYVGHAKHNFNLPARARITGGDQNGFYPDILGHCYEQLGELEKAKDSYLSSAKYYENNGSEIVAPELFEKVRELEMKLELAED